MVSSPPSNHTSYDYYDGDTAFQKKEKRRVITEMPFASVIIIATFNYYVQFHFLEWVGW